MIAHVRFALHLYRNSGRWLAPLVVLILWFLFAIENAPESFDTLAALFPAFLVVSCWIATSLGGVDDRNHREMAAAAAGSRSRLHQARTFASFTVCAVVAALQTVYVALVLAQPDTSVFKVIFVCAAVLLGASSLGAAIGSWLHAPLVSRRAVALAVGVIATMAVILLGPVQEALRRLGNAEIAPGLILSLVASTIAVIAIAGSSTAVNRSNN